MADVNLLCRGVSLNTVRQRDASSSPSHQMSTESEKITRSILCVKLKSAHNAEQPFKVQMNAYCWIIIAGMYTAFHLEID